MKSGQNHTMFPQGHNHSSRTHVVMCAVVLTNVLAEMCWFAALHRLTVGEALGPMGQARMGYRNAPEETEQGILPQIFSDQTMATTRARSLRSWDLDKTQYFMMVNWRRNLHHELTRGIGCQEMLNVLFNKGKKRLFSCRRSEVNEAFLFYKSIPGRICRMIIPALSQRRHPFALTPLPILCPL